MAIPFTPAQREALLKIESVYREIPALQCVPSCHACCGPILMSHLEALRIQGRANPAHEPLVCPYLGKDGCRVYAQRPAICRLFGTMATLACPKGCKPVTGHRDDDFGPNILQRIEAISSSVETDMPFPKTAKEMEAQGYEFTGSGRCRDCKAELDWYRTPQGKNIPMNAGTIEPHWGSCPNAERFRKVKS